MVNTKKIVLLKYNYYFTMNFIFKFMILQINKKYLIHKIIFKGYSR